MKGKRKLKVFSMSILSFIKLQKEIRMSNNKKFE